MKIKYTEVELEGNDVFIVPLSFEKTDLILNNITGSGSADWKKKQEAKKIDKVCESQILAKSYLLSARKIFSYKDDIFNNGGGLIPLVLCELYHQALELLLKSKLYEYEVSVKNWIEHDLTELWKNAFEKACQSQVEYKKMYDNLKLLEENANKSMAYRYTHENWKDLDDAYWNKKDVGVIYRDISHHAALAEMIYKEIESLEILD